MMLEKIADRNYEYAANEACADKGVCRASHSSSPERFARAGLLVAALYLTISAAFFAVPVSARAATWPLASSNLSAQLGFNEEYTAGGKTYVHSGIDIAATAGANVRCVVEGVVSFVGDVPSGDSRTNTASQKTNETMHAVSVKLADGRTLTYMPFADIYVERGQDVSEGASLGTLAAVGDNSSAGSHLHLGLKRNGAYYDPMSLFSSLATLSAQKAGESDAAFLANETAGATTSTSSASALQGVSEAVEGAGVGSWETDTMLAGAEAVVQDAAQAGEEGASLAGEQASSAVDALPDEVAEPAFGTISSGDAVLLPDSSSQDGFAAQIGAAFGPLAQACIDQAEDLAGALRGLSLESGIPVIVLATLAVLAAAGLCAAGVLAARRFLVPYVLSVWRSLIAPLFKRKAGDTMRKLFPASGSAFIARSRLARRR